MVIASNRTPVPIPGSPFRIRPARRFDAELMSGLLRELGYPEGLDSATVNWVISHPEIELLVAADSHDKPIGFLSLSHRPQLRMKGRIATIDELIVTEAWRRRGVGRALLTKAIERCRSLAAKRIELLTHPGNDVALVQQFLEACGFAKAETAVFRHGKIDFLIK